uniref:NADH dehydrogenase subunit 4L n=1 Tax=Kodaianella bicinctifrons TaxID=1201171 RepID=UPI002A8382E2|nr:NADH dehydrogenase subunit 4L [Kodaianella bicinctifrons]WOW98888.1 NADH dehydrogenase subunit 4L [Kodaianella bicinctifrons]
MILGLTIFFSGIISLIFVRKHYLLSLLSLEFMILSLFYLVFFFLGFFFFEFYFLVVFLVLGVCEGVLGLSLIVYLVRKNSLDYLDIISLC